MSRFTREAQVLASRNHPNIAAIYGLEESDGVRALVMELVEGRTLAAVLLADFNWPALPPETPAPIRRLLRRFLERDRKKRLADIADARLEIDESAGCGAGRTNSGAASSKAYVALVCGCGLCGNRPGSLAAALPRVAAR